MENHIISNFDTEKQDASSKNFPLPTTQVIDSSKDCDMQAELQQIPDEIVTVSSHFSLRTNLQNKDNILIIGAIEKGQERLA